MPVAIANLMNSGAQIGPGSAVEWQLTGATITANDFILATCSTHGTTVPGDDIIAGTATFDNSYTGIDFSGFIYLGTNRRVESPTRITSMSTLDGWPESDLSVYIYLQFFHAFTDTAHDQTIGFVWRPDAGLANLITLGWDQLRSTPADIASVLAAIQRTPTVPGQR